MFKKLITTILVLSVLGSLSGCETIRKKFTRKKKAKPVRPMFYMEEEEVTRPPMELYSMHYIFWRSWTKDLVASAGENAKRDRRAAGEIIANLIDMEKYLTGEKKEELAKYIEDVKVITDKMIAGNVSEPRMGRLRQQLDKVARRITNKFYYKKVRDYIVKKES